MDTATSSTAVALSRPDGSTIERRDDPPVGAHPGHATRLLGLAQELLAESGLSWPQVERIAVGAGPGTFTGLRVGIATARGLAQSLNVPLAPVSSLGALVHAALGGEESLLAMIDARRGEVFVLACDPSGRKLGPARAVRPEGLADLLAELGGAGGWLAFGDGALRYREQMESIGVRVPEDHSPLHMVSASVICVLGARDGAGQPFQEVVPDYLRRPDAEIKLDAAGKGAGA